MADHLRVLGIEARGRHGVFAEEKTEEQTFVVDLDLRVDLARAAKGDRLQDTVDYGQLAADVHSLVAAHSFDLIETLASRIAELVLRDVRVESVEVTVHKPEAPIGVPFRDVAVTVERHR